LVSGDLGFVSEGEIGVQSSTSLTSTISVGLRRFAGSHENPGQLVGFQAKGPSVGLSGNVGFGHHLKPESRFVGFFNHDSELVDEVGSRASPTNGAVIRRDGGSRSNELQCHVLAERID